ncbi:hypothetical protein [Halobacterium litoreum]|uniref:DUF3147 family protein n=1 Tax=Halobacterium litoreum TaxID=2039234 RepID=A0ABD5NI10_9EURY|nr:hypothetical protein [Halobacterium litoreum]UHH12278.1 hypothetical protein LT972_08920 [Halobacterium litoreum]
MSSLVARFRAWLGSTEFAVTATAVVAALVAGFALFERAPDANDGYFAVFLAGIAVPSIYREQWDGAFDSRALAVLWSAVACALAVGAYLVLVAVFDGVAGGSVPSVLAFVVTWVLGLFVARVATGRTA